MRASPLFTVMVTIHGPEGWFDVVSDEGETIAVCPKKRYAKELAALLTEQAESRLALAAGDGAGVRTPHGASR